MVVYSGHDTKLMKNQGIVRNKKSHIEKQLNKYIIGIFISQCVFCIILALLATFFNVRDILIQWILITWYRKNIKNILKVGQALV